MHGRYVSGVVLLAVLAVGCGETPGGPTSMAARGKPGTPTSFSVLFSDPADVLTGYVRHAGDPDRNNPLQGGIIGPATTLSGTISGQPGSRVIIATTPVIAQLTILDVVPDQIPWDRNCNTAKEDEMRGYGLVGSGTVLTGKLSYFKVDETERTTWLRLDGIVPPAPIDGSTWHVSGNSTNAAPASIVDNGDNTLTVTQNYGEISIASDSKSKTAPGFSCRAYWRVTVTLP